MINSITGKTLLIVLGIMIPLFLVIYFATEVVFLKSYRQLEEAAVTQNLERGEDALAAKLRSLEAFTSDWANWDDTYEFAQTGSLDYITNNMADVTFTTAEINMMLVLDKSGHIVFEKTYDLENSVDIPSPLGLHEYIDRSFQNGLPEENENSGIVNLSDTPALIVAKPILTSEGLGPSAGTVIVGRFIDASLIEELADTTHLSIIILRVNDPAMPVDFRTAEESILNNQLSYVAPLDDSRIAGYAALEDVFSQPVSIFRVDMPRDIYAQGRSTVNYLHIIILLVGLLCVLLFILIIRRLILARIISLEKNVLDISRTGNLSQRIPLTGKDEVANLAANINTMLNSLEKADQRIQQLYEQEKQHRQELEEEAKARSQFINVLAHELRTPLTPLLISVEALHGLITASKDKVQAKLIGNAYNGVHSLAKRLEDLLELARLTRGTFNLHIQPIESRTFLENAASQYNPALLPKRQRLVLDLAPDLPRMKGDASRLEQVLTNLLSNASKYSPEDTEITLKGSAADGYLLVEVKDGGIGISAEDQKNLFMPYHRVEQDRTYPGIGLGLAVCKQIIEAHGGRIWVESESGKGSIFKFSVPLERE